MNDDIGIHIYIHVYIMYMCTLYIYTFQKQTCISICIYIPSKNAYKLSADLITQDKETDPLLCFSTYS